MKKINYAIQAVFLMFGLMLASCSKSSSSTNNGGNNGSGGSNNNPSAVASLGNIVYDGVTYPINRVSSYGKLTTGEYYLAADASTSSQTIILTVTYTKYLPATSSAPIVDNVMPLTSDKASWSIVITNKSNFSTVQETSNSNNNEKLYFINNGTEIQWYANNNVGYTISGGTGKQISFNFKRTTATIPAANTAFTIPSGMSPTSLTIGSLVNLDHSTFVHKVLAGYDGTSQVNISNNAGKSLDINFADGLPVSGTYDVVSTKAELAPGKVHIKYFQTSPLSSFESVAGGKVVVENVNGVLKVYAKDIDMNTNGTTSKLNVFGTF